MRMQESAEMYLETIYLLCQKSNSVRSVDVAEAMGYSKPSISRAVGLLKQNGYLTVDGAILTLTDAGREIAEKMVERHTVLAGALIALGVDEETASEDACKIEHVISDKAFAAIKEHIHMRGSV